MRGFMGAVLCAALNLSWAVAAELPANVPAPMTLDLLVGKQFAGGWVTKNVNDNGATFEESLILKEDGTYENYLTASGGTAPPISANGRGVWFSRIGADGGIEIALTTDPNEKNPTWIIHPLAIGTLLEGTKVWHR